MSRWADEVEATMYPVVHYVPSVKSTLIIQVTFKLVIYVLNNRPEAEIIICYFHMDIIICHTDKCRK